MRSIQVYDGDGLPPLIDFSNVDPLHGGSECRVLFFTDGDDIGRAYGMATVRKVEKALSIVVGSSVLPANEQLKNTLINLCGSIKKFNLEILGVRYVCCSVQSVRFHSDKSLGLCYLQICFERTVQRD